MLRTVISAVQVQATTLVGVLLTRSLPMKPSLDVRCTRGMMAKGKQREGEHHLREEQQRVAGLLAPYHDHHHGGHYRQRARGDSPVYGVDAPLQEPLHHDLARHRA
eukprot:CAMPEP_0173331584 /NCGR_PEP_ID=MMETSP1144-20121109/3878_1 /TAXON_ID=483371 /ORGANISM="non described non described, Strain CCMP2298" /LENGTH=105 /DNA_ID=CAMNT_0014276373 /DNA_START=264 /DNA_END=578 /DNA_ORIENTATION=-